MNHLFESTDSSSLLQTQNLSLGFDRLLIQNLNLDLKLGDRLIVYGPNGCGKSTLLSTLMNPNPQQKKQLHWNLPQDQILYLHQQPSFHSHTPDDVESYLMNILLMKKPFASPKEADRQKVREILTKIRLPNMPLKNLSGGQRQKLKMARGLLITTQVLILDEPFNAVDQQSTREMIEWLNEIKNKTLQILVLHDFEQIERLKSKILWVQSDQWEILDFADWFQKVDRQFHSWIHATQKSNPSPKSEVSK